ncbi:MAG TPA: glycosyltransferase [Alphaproteobacteria bacterium]|nr:glycosyltransferase [Alphaproteobacteria bacterium]
MRVLHIYKNYPPVRGGIENHLRTLATGLVCCGAGRVQVLVASVGWQTTRENDAGVEVIRAGRQLEVAQTPLSWRLCRELARSTPDIVHLHVPYPMGELAQLLFGRSRRLVMTYHSDIVRQRHLLRLYEPILWQVLHRADRIIVSSWRYAYSSRFLTPFLAKCVRVPYGIDLAFFQKTDAARVAMVRRSWPGPLVLFVGRFRYYKGLPYLVDAAQWIQGTVLLVGGGPTEAPLRRQVRRLGRRGRVIFAGEVSDDWLASYYAAADVFVLPSVERSEAFGIVQLEAMASGLPVVSTELGTGTSYVNVHGETGLIVPPRDARALADAVNLLLKNPELRERLGATGRARVAAQFTKDRMVEQVSTLYRSLM